MCLSSDGHGVFFWLGSIIYATPLQRKPKEECASFLVCPCLLQDVRYYARLKCKVEKNIIIRSALFGPVEREDGKSRFSLRIKVKVLQLQNVNKFAQNKSPVGLHDSAYGMTFNSKETVHLLEAEHVSQLHMWLQHEMCWERGIIRLPKFIWGNESWPFYSQQSASGGPTFIKGHSFIGAHLKKAVIHSCCCCERVILNWPRGQWALAVLITARWRMPNAGLEIQMNLFISQFISLCA